jgi:hypothetical protein
MPQAAQVICPGCKKVLRIPVELFDQAVRCRHCGKAIRARAKKDASGRPIRIADPSGKSPIAEGQTANTPEVGADFRYVSRARRGKLIGLVIICVIGIAALAFYFHRANQLRKLAKEQELTRESVAEGELGSQQSRRLAGERIIDKSHGNLQSAEPHKLEIPNPSLAAERLAERSEIQNILREINLPTIELIPGRATLLQIDTLPYSAKAMAPYRADCSLSEIQSAPEKFPLRLTVLKAVRLLNDEFDPKHGAVSIRHSFSAQNSARTKAEILKEQTKAAKVLLRLQEALEELRKVGEKRDQEASKRWQAHYDYVLAQLLSWIAMVNEYDLMLGKIRRDELPELTPNVHSGYKLSSQEKMQSGKEIKELTAESKNILAKLAKDHPGTPWEILAKRAQQTVIGLKWEPMK